MALSLATIASGSLYDRFGAGAYQAMTGLSVLGMVSVLASYGLDRWAGDAGVGKKPDRGGRHLS